MVFLMLDMIIYPTRKAHIILLLVKEVIVPKKYSDFPSIFLKKSAEAVSKRQALINMQSKCKKISEQIMVLLTT